MIRPSSFRLRRPARLVAQPRPPAELRAYDLDDLEAIMEIERASFPSPMSELKMRMALAEPGVIGTVAERAGSVVGFSVHVHREATVSLLALAVAPRSRRLGVGSSLLARVKMALTLGRWRAVETAASLDQVPGLLFLKARGFVPVPDFRGRHVDELSGYVRMRCSEVSVLDTGCSDDGVE
jgi:GNAT superfamily N-acetyltransferase